VPSVVATPIIGSLTTSMSGCSTRTDTQSPALHVADSHDLIRVQRARENNHKDVSVETPKRLADEQRASETASDRLLLLGKASASLNVVALLLCAMSDNASQSKTRASLLLCRPIQGAARQRHVAR
jgi:hypothetical protein